MKKLLLSTLILTLFFTHGKAQSRLNLQSFPSFGIMHFFVPSEASLQKNDHYIDSSFKKGKLITKKNRTINSFQFRYNIENDEMECKLNSQYSKINFPNKVKEIEIDGECFEYKKYVVRKDTSIGYLHRLRTGEKPVFAKYYMHKTKNSTRIENSFFVSKKNGSAPVQFNSAKKLLTYIHGDLAEKASAYTKVNGLNINKASDLKKTLNYLSMLEESVAER